MSINTQEPSGRFIDNFKDAAKKYSDNTAIICGENSITYKNLMGIVTQYKDILNDNREKCSAVVIYLPRNIRTIAMLIACQDAGFSYIPIDSTITHERLKKIIDHNNYLVIYDKIHTPLPEITSNKISILDVNGIPVIHGRNNIITSSKIDVVDLSKLETYRIYTSGSTGEPKGVMVSEKNCCNLLGYFKNLLQANQGMTFLSSTSIAFDIFYLEYSIPLSSGGTLIFLPNSDAASAQKIAQFIQHYNPDIYQATPSMFKCLLPYLQESFLFNKILIGGEALGEHLSDLLFKKSRWLCNVYGPTETTVWSTANIIQKAGDTRIGSPISNTRIFILDEDSNLLENGQEGYIHIGGDGVALGYYRNSELTDKFFIWKSIENISQRLYNTQDIGFIDDDGYLNYIRRAGDFYKINGYRIEPGEIVNSLEEHADILEAAVIAPQNTDTQESILVAYIRTKLERTGDLGFVKEYLQHKLPAYMIPTFIFKIEDFQYTISGKMDIKYLYNLYNESENSHKGNTNYNVNEQPLIYSILAKYINVHGMKDTENIFRRGLTSLQAVSLHLDLQEYNPHFELYQLFENPTVDELNNLLEMSEAF